MREINRRIDERNNNRFNLRRLLRLFLVFLNNILYSVVCFLVF